MKRIVLLSIVLAFALPLAAAQTVLTVSGPAGINFATTGPPAAPCGYPTGPIVGVFPFVGIVVCPLPFLFPFPGAGVGDVAANRAADTMWVTDGITFGEYTAIGLPISSFPLPVGLALPGPVTGLDFAPGAGVLWITDGVFVAAIVPPPAPGCAAAVVAVPAFPSPSPGPLSDIAFAPATGTLWGVDAAGFVTNFLVGGALGPFGVFPVAPAPCPLAVPLHGIAFDTTTGLPGAPPVLYVTDGVTIERFLPGGAPAPPSFYSPFACYPVPAPPVNGLGFTLTPITYGVGTDPLALPPPVIGATGQSATPSGPMTITLTGAAPGPLVAAGLFYSLGAACPAIPFLGGNLLYLAPPLFGPLGPFPVVGGAFTFGPFALPPGLPVGLPIFFQWIVSKGPGLGFQVTGGLEMTIGLP